MLVASKLHDLVEQFRCVDGFPSKSIAAAAYYYYLDKFPMDEMHLVQECCIFCFGIDWLGGIVLQFQYFWDRSSLI